ncbi:MAG: SGNH/GDSL hydrolase family protein [Pirellulaceae bacterium]
MQSFNFSLACFLVAWTHYHTSGHAQETPVKEIAAARTTWEYSPELLRPFWSGDTVVGETILFLGSESGDARGSVLFPIQEIVSVRSSAGDVTYQAGVDYRFVPGTREIVVPTKSKIKTSLPADLRRPANSQQFQLTHRDGDGEILFGAKLEYHQLQTVVTYKKAETAWPVQMPKFDALALPLTLRKLRDRESVSIVLLGDSISTGCNASGWGEGAPFQPAYQDLLVDHLSKHYGGRVKLTNLSVGGQATPWGITMIDEVIKHQPDLVILAFGMNDSAGRSAAEYAKNTAAMIEKTRVGAPQAEFILIASMLGNRDWTRLNHDVFPAYRDALATLASQTGVVLADMTSVWQEMLKRKKDADLTGNGVNHPNDFGHRVYAQVLASLLVETQHAPAPKSESRISLSSCQFSSMPTKSDPKIPARIDTAVRRRNSILGSDVSWSTSVSWATNEGND